MEERALAAHQIKHWRFEIEAGGRGAAPVPSPLIREEQEDIGWILLRTGEANSSIRGDDEDQEAEDRCSRACAAARWHF